MAGLPSCTRATRALAGLPRALHAHMRPMPPGLHEPNHSLRKPFFFLRLSLCSWCWTPAAAALSWMCAWRRSSAPCASALPSMMKMCGYLIPSLPCRARHAPQAQTAFSRL